MNEGLSLRSGNKSLHFERTCSRRSELATSGRRSERKKEVRASIGQKAVGRHRRGRPLRLRLRGRMRGRGRGAARAPRPVDRRAAWAPRLVGTERRVLSLVQL